MPARGCRFSALTIVVKTQAGDRRRHGQGDDLMKYLFLLYADEGARPAPGSPELEATLGAYGAFYELVSANGAFQAGDPVQASSSATTVTVRDGATATASGPARPGG